MYTGKDFATHIKDCVNWFVGFGNEYDLPSLYTVVDEKQIEKICAYLNNYGPIHKPMS